MGYSGLLWGFVAPVYSGESCTCRKEFTLQYKLYRICILRSLRYHILSPILNEGNLYFLSGGYNMNCFPTAFPPKLVGDIRIF